MLDQDVNRIVDEIVARLNEREGARLSSVTYSSRPLIQTGRQMRERAEAARAAQERPQQQPLDPQPRQQRPRYGSLNITPPQREPAHDPTPPIYHDMAMLARDSHGSRFVYGVQSAALLFSRQARMMESWEDDCPYQGTFVQYYPTYESLSTAQLRGYFTWRAAVRRGEMPEAPQAFAFILAYELLAGVGTTPGTQGLADLKSLRDRYGATEAGQRSTFVHYLNRWLRDYAVYHDLPEAHEAPLYEDAQVAHAVSVLRAAQAHVLKGLGKQPRIAPKTLGEAPSTSQLFQALCAGSSYRLEKSRLAKDRPTELQEVCELVFSGFVDHCARRRKTDFVEGLFGGPNSWPYTMFASAVFHEETPHANAHVVVDDTLSFTCKNGAWTYEKVYDGGGASRELGDLLRATDQRLRDALDYRHPLKAKSLQRYEAAIIDRAIETWSERQKKAKRVEVKVDFAQLGGIRSAAAHTREALLVDEERFDDTTDAVPQTSEPEPSTPKAAEGKQAPAHDAQAGRVASDSALPYGLTSDEFKLIEALLAGTPLPEQKAGGFMSLTVDSINDKLFELVGDTVLELTDDTPELIEDYRDDLQGALSA